jgi:hypothetical protein
MKKAVFWDMAPGRSGVNRRFGRTYRLHLQGRGESSLLLMSLTDALRADFLIFPLYPEDGGDTSVNTTATRCHIPEDCFLHSHRRENLKSYKLLHVSALLATWQLFTCCNLYIAIFFFNIPMLLHFRRSY